MILNNSVFIWMKDSFVLSVFFIVLLGGSSLMGQEENNINHEVVVHLQDGSKLIGTIQEWEYGGNLTLLSRSGTQYVLPSNAVVKIVDFVLEPKQLKVKKPYRFKEKGYFYAGRMHLILGNSGPRANDQAGYGLSIVAGKRWSRLLGLGIGVGYDNMIDDTGESVMPIFLELSGYFSQKNTSFFYNVAAGYSLAFTDVDYNIIDAKGGIMIYPSTGIRFGTGKTKFTVDLGYKFQKAVFTYGTPWDIRVSDQHRLTYKRLVLRFGLLF